MVAEREHSTSPTGVLTETRMLERVETFTRVVSPARARAILEESRYERQRELHLNHVRTLLAEMVKGALTMISVALAQLPDGQTKLLDGQHRLTALAELSGSMLVAFTIHHVKSEDELDRLYLTFDVGRRRTGRDGLQAMQVGKDSSLSMTVLGRIRSAAVIAESGFSRDPRQRQLSLIEASAATAKWLSCGEQYAMWLNGSNGRVSRLLWRAPVAAVALVTIEAQPEAADTFWSTIARRDPLEKNDPRFVLLEWLEAHQSQRNGGPIRDCRYVGAAWNAFFEGRQITKLMLKNPADPVRLSGTRFGGGSRE